MLFTTLSSDQAQPDLDGLNKPQLDRIRIDVWIVSETEGPDRYLEPRAGLTCALIGC